MILFARLSLAHLFFLFFDVGQRYEPAKHRPLSSLPTPCGLRGPGPPSFSLLTLDAEDKSEGGRVPGLGQKADLGWSCSFAISCCVILGVGHTLSEPQFP